ncbi:MAG: type II toxin-antitoxin system VapC family toxin [Armatimonadetes bacterium]|nr:type II toxin-antitoxin system VapC family toxin [Armatimonadota bacterium]
MAGDREPSYRLRVYLDTSVFSAYLDERMPERRQLTAEFWLRLPELRACTSVLARDELSDTPDAGRRHRLLGLLEEVVVHEVTAQMRGLASEYVSRGIFTEEQLDDATHVAVALLTDQSALVSWNFRHLVNRRRRAMIEGTNRALGLPTIDIVSPPEV